jgi:ABC-2 type transport system ATP-binding protein
MNSINSPALEIKNLNKIYKNDFQALFNINLKITKGEIFALLGPNGAGKTTLIGAICGLIKPSTGQIKIFGYDHINDYRIARTHIGLVPQELTTDPFETVSNTVKFSREVFGKSSSSKYINSILKELSLWNKRNVQIRTLSGGMKRRVLIAKALSHEPNILFLDEPSSGVDVDLRQAMWNQIRKLRDSGVSIILTTHYIAEAEAMADRIGILNRGKLIVVEEKASLIKKLGIKKLIIDLFVPISTLPPFLKKFDIFFQKKGYQLVLTYDPDSNQNLVMALLEQLRKNNIAYKDISTYKSSLEEIFIQLINT